MKFRRIYWLLLALAFFTLSLLNIYIADFTQYAAFFSMLFSFLFFALFFLSKEHPKLPKEEKPTPILKEEKSK